MSEIEQLNKIRLQVAARQQAYYERNREDINLKRRLIYAKRTQEKPQKEAPPTQTASGIAVGQHKTDFSKSRTITYEQSINGLNSLDIKAKTRDPYKDDLKR